MTQTIIDFFTSITGNDYLTLYVISIIPIIELRGAIVFMSGMFTSAQEMIAGMFCCVAGSTTVILPLIIITRPLIRRMKKSKWFSKLAKNMEATLASRAEAAYSEEKDKSKNAEQIAANDMQAVIDGAESGKRKKKPMSTDTKKFLGLFAFVAIPLPMTGAWTASCIGSFLEFPVWKAALAVFLGNIVAGSILTIIAYFLPQQYSDLFLYGFVILAIAIAVILYFTRSKRMEKQRQEAIAKYGDRNIYELSLLKKEAGEDAGSLIKKEYIDENGDRHIIIGRDAKKNESVIDDDKVI
ncbi:MAG: small multi-drug export protein [Clostridiales bacterium]|nr:small multi-drug export protein [Clostridiales bacterium]